VTAQRWYAVEAHRHGKGRWTRYGPQFPSREHAKAWARGRGYVPREEAVNGSRQAVYRVIEIDGRAAVKEREKVTD